MKTIYDIMIDYGVDPEDRSFEELYNGFSEFILGCQTIDFEILWRWYYLCDETLRSWREIRDAKGSLCIYPQL
jgi:hypothetical protein